MGCLNLQIEGVLIIEKVSLSKKEVGKLKVELIKKAAREIFLVEVIEILLENNSQRLSSGATAVHYLYNLLQQDGRESS